MANWNLIEDNNMISLHEIGFMATSFPTSLEKETDGMDPFRNKWGLASNPSQNRKGIFAGTYGRDSYRQ